MFNQQRSVLVIHSYIIIEINMNGDDFMEFINTQTLFSTINQNNQQEYFTKLVYNNQIIDQYYISNFGRIWSTRWNRFLAQSPDKDGYMRVSIVIDGKSKTVKVHRLILMTFCPVLNPDEYEGNHCDGVKNHNDIINLEWTTDMGNTRHGWDTGLNQNKGEGNVKTYLKDEDIHRICSILEKGYRPCDICNEFNISDSKERMRFSAIISSISKCKSYRHISKDYNINGSQGRDRYSLEFAHLVCQFLYDENRQYTDEEIMNYLEIPEIDRPKFVVYLSDLRRRRTALSVTQFYENRKNHKV